MNILFINHYAGSPQHGMEHRSYYLAHEWQKLGHRVRIVAASHSHLRVKPPTMTSTFTEELVDGVPYVWLQTPNYQGNGSKRVLNMFVFVGQLFRFANRLISQQKPDLVIASSTYLLDNLPARLIARRCRAKHVYEVHDLWPLSPVEVGNMSSRHPFIQLLQWAENFAYRSAHRVISMLPNAKPHMEAHGMAPEKFAYVPNGIVVSEWESGNTELPQGHTAALDALRKSGQFIVGYAGGHAVSNALEFLVEAARLLAGKPVAFVLVGAGAEKVNLMAKAQALGLRNITFLPAVSKSSIPALLRAMDVLYIGWLNKPIYRFGVSPNKISDYMMAGKPVIHAVNASNDVVAESRCGITVPPEDPEAVAGAVCALLAMPVCERQAMGQRGHDYVVANHDYRILAQRFIAAIQ